MIQAELNRRVAQQFSESVSEIARRGFSFVEVSDAPATPQVHEDEAVATVVGKGDGKGDGKGGWKIGCHAHVWHRQASINAHRQTTRTQH
jgi:hypothetical protein|tara:strand:+ start:125 stop:394 length:270 start_codon:yes stop_codon:yes gene_type:complete